IEVAISYVPVLRGLIVSLLVAIGLIKAVLVALYYMHLKSEGAVIYSVATLPVIFSVIIIVAIQWDINAAQFARVTVEYSQNPADHPEEIEAAGHGSYSGASGGSSMVSSTVASSAASVGAAPAAVATTTQTVSG